MNNEPRARTDSELIARARLDSPQAGGALSARSCRREEEAQHHDSLHLWIPVWVGSSSSAARAPRLRVRSSHSVRHAALNDWSSLLANARLLAAVMSESTTRALSSVRNPASARTLRTNSSPPTVSASARLAAGSMCAGTARPALRYGSAQLSAANVPCGLSSI